MNKSELVDVIAARQAIPRKKAEAVVDLVFEMMVDALKHDDRIEVRGFGSFVLKRYGAYQGRNPRSGDPIDVPPKRMPFFKVGKELRERVDTSGNGTPVRPAVVSAISAAAPATSSDNAPTSRAAHHADDRVPELVK